MVSHPSMFGVFTVSYRLFLFMSFSVPTILVAHEFFDALPVNQFQVSTNPRLLTQGRGEQ